MSEIERLDNLLNTVNHAAIAMLSADDNRFEDLLLSGMELIGRSLDVDRVQIWQNEIIDGELYYVLKYRWISDVKWQIIPNVGATIRDRGILEWKDVFLRGGYVGSDELSESTQELLGREYDVKSIVVIPLFLQDQFWGVFSINGCKNERTFTKEEVDILRSTSLMMANAVNRHIQAAKVRKAEEREQIMFNATPLCTDFWSKDLKNIDCNQAAVSLFELSSKQEYLDRFHELSPKYQPCGSPSYEKCIELVKRAFEEGYCRFEWMHQKLNGEPIPCEVTLVRVKYEDDYAVVGYARDLREHKRMMSEIERRGNLLNTVNLAAIAMLSTEDDEKFENTLLSGMELIGRSMDADRVLIFQNEVIDDEYYFVLRHEWLSDFGREKTPILGLKVPYRDRVEWLDIFMRGGYINGPLSELPQNDQIFLRDYGLKSIVTIPLFLQDQFWGIFSVNDCRRDRRFTDGEVDIMRSTSLMMASIVNRNLQNAKIRKADERMQIMLDTTPIGAVFWNKNIKGIECNQEAVKLFELSSKKEFLDRFHELSPEYQPCGELSRAMVFRDITKTFEEGYKRFEWMHQKLNGEPVPCEITLVRVKYEDDYVILGYIRDLREHKSMLEEMHKVENDLRLARDAAEAANKAKSTFIANMSHEIRTPMNSIIGFAELALDEHIPPKTEDYLLKIKENAEWLLLIINDILDVSKVESGRFTLEIIPFDLHEIFAYCQTTIMPKAIEKGLSLRLNVEHYAGKKLLGDPTRLRQVLINFLSNSVKFTDAGTVKISSSILDSTEDSVTMRFEVRDTGIGMTSEQVKRIYEPFMQADSSTTRKYGGTGLGLPITKSIIELMGGQLTVDSVLGVGSKFSFDLVFDTIDAPVDILKDGILISEFEKPIFDGEVLVCEDNAMNQQVICEHLMRVGLQTVVAHNGQEGVDIVKNRIASGEKPFDLILMDIHMPVMDGVEAASTIASLQTGTPIVAMTANIMPRDRELYESSGMPDCVSKPFTSQELWRCLLKYLSPVSWGIVNNKHQMDEKERLQRRLKIDFAKGNRTKLKEITKAIDEGDIKLAHRLAHNLKSVAGQIGKIGLRNAAAEVEVLLKDGKNLVTADNMNLLEVELNFVLNELVPMMVESKAPTEPFDESQTSALLKKLEHMLQSRNTECHDLLDSIRAIPGAELLAEQVEDFDFKAAISTLSELKKKWG